MVIILKKRYYILMILSVVGVKLFDNKLSFITKDINESKIVFIIAPNLYNYDSVVSTNNIAVLDYFIKNDKLFIKPLNNEVVLPINGIISKCSKNELILSTKDCIYKISNLNNSNMYLYQFYNSYTNIGTTDDYYIVSGDNLEEISRSLSIEYIDA